LQSILQTFKLVALPFAIASILPIAWTSSFFRNATIEAGLPDSTLRGVIAKSAKRASVNARGNWLGILVLWVISLLTFLNVYILAALLPLLIRMFSGIETDFTRYVGSFFGFNLFCVVVALSWLLLDPLVLSYSVVRCFDQEARTDGRDLLAQLRPAAALALLLLTFAWPHSLTAAQTAITKDKLSRAVEQAAKSADYAWLRAHKSSKANDDTFISRLDRDIDDVFKTVGSWFSGVKNWWKRMWERSRPEASSEPAAGKPVSSDVLWLLYSLATLVLVAAVIVVWRSRVKPVEPSAIATSLTPTPDLNKETLLASDLPEEEWLRMARELLAKGELRLAVRAMHLSNLSYLGSQQFIRIAKSKSNSIYEREIRLRPRGGEVSAPFVQSNRSFERVWYGFHEVTAESIEVFQQNVEAIRQYAKA
jgi:uncharacterized membrane protein